MKLYQSYCTKLVFQLFEQSNVADFLWMLIHRQLDNLTRCMLMNGHKASVFVRNLPDYIQRALNECTTVYIDNVMHYKYFLRDIYVFRFEIPNSHFFKQCRKWLVRNYPALNIINPIALLQDSLGNRYCDMAYRPGHILSNLIPQIRPESREILAMSFFQQALMAMIQNKAAFGSRADQFRYLSADTVYVEYSGVIKFVIPNLLSPEIVCRKRMRIANSPYTPPELRRSFFHMLNSRHEYAEDMWAIGVICLEIILGHRIANQMYVDLLTRSDINILFKNSGMQVFIMLCLSRNVNNRPDLYSALAITYLMRSNVWVFSASDDFAKKAFEIMNNQHREYLTKIYMLRKLIIEDLNFHHRIYSRTEAQLQTTVQYYVERISGAIISAKNIMLKL